MKIKNLIRCIGLMFALALIVVIYAIWFYYRVILGSVWFTTGEPNNIILITEWSLGFLSIVVITNELRSFKSKEVTE